MDARINMIIYEDSEGELLTSWGCAPFTDERRRACKRLKGKLSKCRFR